MPSKRRLQCAECGALARPRSRYCASHQRRLAKYGSPKGTPVEYRSQVKPKYHRWVRDGMQRLSDHPALLASLTLAQQALDFAYEPLPGE